MRVEPALKRRKKSKRLAAREEESDDEQERQMQLGQIRTETSRSIESLMGGQGAVALQGQAGGRNWLNNLGRVNPLPIAKPTFQVITGGTPNP